VPGNEVEQVPSLSHSAQELQQWLVLAKEPHLPLVLAQERVTPLMAHGCYTCQQFHPLVLN
jgi:hypothetical protein